MSLIIDQLIALSTTKNTLEILNKTKLILQDYDTLSATLPQEQDAPTPELAQAIHKLKSPYSALTGYIELLKMASSDLESDKAQKWLAKTQTTSQELESQLQKTRSLF